MKPASLLAPEQMDALGLALLSLAREVWVMKDRQMLLEAFLETKGLVGALEAYTPDPEFSIALAKERDRFVSSITDVLFANTSAPINQDH